MPMLGRRIWFNSIAGRHFLAAAPRRAGREGEAMTQQELKELVAPLRPGDKLNVAVIFNERRMRLSYEIELQCNRQAWPAPWRQSGWTRRRFIGRARTKESAAKRSAQLIR